MDVGDDLIVTGYWYTALKLVAELKYPDAIALFPSVAGLQKYL